MAQPPATPVRFLTDAMLGRLARWLRVVGYDTVHGATESDHELVRCANEERRVLLTRDRHLLRELRPDRAFEITSDDPLEPLAQVVAAFELPPPRATFARCTIDNSALQPASAAQAAALPPGAGEHTTAARYCPTCGRLYWLGSHARRMESTLRGRFPALD